MIYKERTDKTFAELKTTKENFLQLTHCSFLYNNGEIYVECLVTAKVYIIGEGFIGIVEKAYGLLDDIKIAPKGDFGFDWLDKYNISLNGIVFNGEDEIENFLEWFDKVMLNREIE